MTKEIWKPICTEYQSFYSWKYFIKPIYEVSNTGKIRNKNTGKLISIREGGNNVTLSGKQRGSCLEERLGLSLARIFHQTFNGPLKNNGRVKFINDNGVLNTVII